MPDVFTGVLVLVLALLIFVPERLSRRERVWLVAFAAFMIAAHQSHVLLALVLLAVLLPLRAARRRRRRCDSDRRRSLLAVIALVSVNLLAFGRASLSPFGNVFLLARVIYDGPGMDVLRRDCPAAGWRLCAFVDRMPAIADDFLWRAGRSGGAGRWRQAACRARQMRSSRAALARRTSSELRAFGRNPMQQLARFRHRRRAAAVARHRHARGSSAIFHASRLSAYAASRQTVGELAVPGWMQTLHIATALAGVAGMLRNAADRTRASIDAGGFAAAVLLALLANAAITGGLSGPHDRYQSRIMWLPPLIAVLGIASLRRPVLAPAFSR